MVSPLLYCILFGTVGSFPLLSHQTRLLKESPLASLSVSGASPGSLDAGQHWIRDYSHAVVSKVQNNHRKTAKAKPLWYRDRSSAEEQMTQDYRSPRLTLTDPVKPKSALDAEVTAPMDFKPFGLVNLPLVQATCTSHAKLLLFGWTIFSAALFAKLGPLDWHSLHWNGDAFPFHSLLEWTLTPLQLLEGVSATVPLVGLSTVIGSSDYSHFCPLHFSISKSVLALFGRRERQGQAGTNMFTLLCFSLEIATVSALSEELIFRGLLPTTLFSYTHSMELALVGQAVLFGLGQVRHKSTLTENAVFSILQCIHGLWYGTVYLGTGGDILPVLVAHVLFQCHIFVGGWKMVNDQLDYAENYGSSTKAEEGLSPSELLELETIRIAAGDKLGPETLAYCRQYFYTFDCDHLGSLSFTDVKRAVAYAFLDDPVKPGDDKTREMFQEIVRSRFRLYGQGKDYDRLTLSEFLQLLFTLKSKTWNEKLA